MEILWNRRQMQHFWKIVQDFIHNHRSHSVVAIRSENNQSKLKLWIHESALSVRSARMIRHQHLLFWWFASHYMMVNVYSCPDLSGKLHTLTRCAHTGEQSLCATYVYRSVRMCWFANVSRCCRKETTKKEGEITAWVAVPVYIAILTKPSTEKTELTRETTLILLKIVYVKWSNNVRLVLAMPFSSYISLSLCVFLYCAQCIAL